MIDGSELKCRKDWLNWTTQKALATMRWSHALNGCSSLNGSPLPVTSGLPLRLEHPFNACDHLIVANAFPVVQLSQSFLHFSSEPSIMAQVGFYYFLDQLVSRAAALRSSTLQFSLEFRTKSYFHGNSLT